jgi:formylglycine-generating enzyme required for sulfatase activity
VAEFDLGRFEVTQEQWEAVMLTNPSQYVGARRPVENVSWNDVQDFIGRMNRFGRRTYRLPTEAEWEYASRAGSTTAYPWGATFLPEGCRYANVNDRTFRDAAPKDPLSQMSVDCSDGFYRTAPVGGRLPNALGLHDMQGNVWEWTADGYHPSYDRAPTDGSAWGGASAHTDHVLRGGSWHSLIRRHRSAQREKEPADYRIGYTGFRLAASVPQ